MKVGYLGGSFNPIHNAHITLALKAMEECNLDKVILSIEFLGKYN